MNEKTKGVVAFNTFLNVGQRIKNTRIGGGKKKELIKKSEMFESSKGVDEKEAWNGLKNYMEDFSMMKEKEVPELALWEKYLVFATAFGIADKVLKQLKVIKKKKSNKNFNNVLKFLQNTFFIIR